MSDYEEFIETRAFKYKSEGFDPIDLNVNLKPHQVAITNWACKRGNAAIFADTGLGKSIMQLEWASQVSQKTGKPVIVFAPLAVGRQTEGEAKKFNIKSSCKYMRQFDGTTRLVVTNYEMIDNFNPDDFGGIVLDESSILKGQSGAYRKKLTDFAKNIGYRLSCTATPSPNDFMELGTQAEFLGVMPQSEMLAMFFTHDGSNTQKWRLKGHGASRFWEWMATWACVISSPADLGFDAKEYDLPPLTIHEVILPSSGGDQLFSTVAQGLGEARAAKRKSLDERVVRCSELVNLSDDAFIIWGELNDETDKLADQIDGAVQIKGADKIEVKEYRMAGFSNGDIKKLVSKSSICGFGMNWQHSNKMAFVAPTYSFEGFYQAIRRQWRFGQTKPVDVYVFMTEEETGIHANMLAKMENDKIMRSEMIKVMSKAMNQEIHGLSSARLTYAPDDKMVMPSFL